MIKNAINKIKNQPALLSNEPPPLIAEIIQILIIAATRYPMFYSLLNSIFSALPKPSTIPITKAFPIKKARFVAVLFTLSV